MRKVALVGLMFLMLVGIALADVGEKYYDSYDIIMLRNGEEIRGKVIEQDIINSLIKVETPVEGEIKEVAISSDDIALYKSDISIKYKKKSGGVAFALSFLIVGGGQYYNGQPGKAIIQEVMYVSGIGMILNGSSPEADASGRAGSIRSPTVIRLGIVIASISAIWSWIDAPVSSPSITERNLEKAYKIAIGMEKEKEKGDDYYWNYGIGK